jgi:hypothetical protein
MKTGTGKRIFAGIAAITAAFIVPLSAFAYGPDMVEFQIEARQTNFEVAKTVRLTLNNLPKNGWLQNERGQRRRNNNRRLHGCRTCRNLQSSR